jgi:hypothetical protein
MRPPAAIGSRWLIAALIARSGLHSAKRSASLLTGRSLAQELTGRHRIGAAELQHTLQSRSSMRFMFGGEAALRQQPTS